MPSLLLLVQAALGASADAFLIGWEALGRAPAQPEAEARGPEGIEAGPEGRLAFWDPVRGEVVLLEGDRIARRIRVRAADDLLLLERDLLLLDRAAREVQRWSLDGRLRERRALPALTPSGVRLAEQGGEVFGADLFGNRHPLFALEEGGITAPRTPGIAAPVTAVRASRESEAGTAVLRLLPRKARLLGADGARWVQAEKLTPGDRLRVLPGERVPVDARVLSGGGHVSTAVVDGEPRARRVGPGSAVPGGSSVGEAALDLEVTAPASDSLLARIAGHVALATGRGGEAAQVLDAVVRIFVPFVLGLAVLCGAAWLAAGLAPALAFERALTVLVVSCPCALGIAGPLARVLTAGALARRGILARDEGALDRIAAARRVAFDKTGTLTEGRLALVWHQALGLPDGEALALVRAAERDSGHPVAEALRRAVPEGPDGASDLQVAAGLGVRARVAGVPVRAGRCAWVEAEAGESLPQPLLEALGAQERLGRSAVACWLGPGRWLGLAFDDPTRPEAAGALAALQALGLKTAVLSGDAQATTARLGAALGIAEVLGACLPEDKAAWLRAREAEDGVRAIFAGDGINDAPAMAAAVGVAVASGTDFARETAAVLLLDGDLHALPDLLRSARRMRGVILQNLAWAALYNAIALPAALFGYLNPVLAAAAMVCSGLAVTFSALRLRGGVAGRGRRDRQLSGRGGPLAARRTPPGLTINTLRRIGLT